MKQVMVFCDFCGGGFEVDKRVAEAKERERAAARDPDDGEFLPLCEECAKNLEALDAVGADSGAAVEYFVQYLLNGVTLKNAYRILMKRRVFSLALTSYALRLRARPSQRQDGKRGVRLSFGQGGGSAAVMPPIFMEVGGTDGIMFGKPFYAGEKHD
ncbi:MAG: hypothetical protein LBP62_01175 [Clostridiales bacterium]|jgi:hypothetical protein|nr:hypothetical protein [Clostridiales bacterium]